jgi:hypothetical protein
LGATKLVDVYYYHVYGNLIAENPWFVALTMMIMGTLLFVAGFLGEFIIRQSRAQELSY